MSRRRWPPSRTPITTSSASRGARRRSSTPVSRHSIIKRDAGPGTFNCTGTRSRRAPIALVRSPTSPWRMAAAITGVAAVGLRADPARPLQTLPLVGTALAPRGHRFTVGERQTLLFSGIGTCSAGPDDIVRVERAATTYQRNAWGLADPSWLDVQTPATLQLIVRETRNRILAKFPRMKLADDGTRLGAGQAVVTPSTIRAELVALYSELEEAGLAENMAAFKEHLIVERDANDPNRINVLFPPDLVNQLRIFAMLVQFRLQYPSAAVAAAA